jgi:tRNA-specific adenosine deaminase 1
MKCLPASKVPEAYGNVLHDWHAEIVALRAFNQFLLEDCKVLSSTAVAPSRFVSRKEITAAGAQPFAIKDEVKWHMYCSEAPCKWSDRSETAGN